MQKAGKSHGFVREGGLVEGIDFAIDVQLPEPAADELRYLRAEVEDEDLIHCASS